LLRSTSFSILLIKIMPKKFSWSRLTERSSKVWSLKSLSTAITTSKSH
jgi:hypothetical protein